MTATAIAQGNDGDQSYDILQGDARSVLRHLPSASIDLVLTDPPYLVGYRDRTGRTVANDNEPQAVLPVYAELYRVLKEGTFCLTFAGWSHLADFTAAWKEAGLRIVGQIVWEKSYVTSVGYTAHSHESAWLLTKGRPPRPSKPLKDVQPWIYSGNRAHPTEKAVEILKPLIERYSEPGGLVLDPFCGSGSTAVAASLTGRRWLGIEIEQRHCQTARSRLAGAERFRSLSGQGAS